MKPKEKGSPAGRPQTHCRQKTFEFQACDGRKVVADLTGGELSSDAGALLLRQPGRTMGLGRAAAACFHDRRDPDLIGHSVEQLLAQRIHALATGCEDLNDHDRLRHATLFALCAGRPGLKPGAPASDAQPAGTPGGPLGSALSS
ncbi:MAG: transposase [Opitutaceae bacterium]|jgi:hypothetical protein|nr:transposase [Opitutaceae bacterium]